MQLQDGWRKRLPSWSTLKGGERRTKIIGKGFISHITNNHFIPEFNKMMTEKGIKLEYVDYPAPDAKYKEKVVLDLAAGEAPDMIFIDLPWVGELVDAEYLADLTPKVNQWNEWDQWPPATKGL